MAWRQAIAWKMLNNDQLDEKTNLYAEMSAR